MSAGEHRTPVEFDATGPKTVTEKISYPVEKLSQKVDVGPKVSPWHYMITDQSSITHGRLAANASAPMKQMRWQLAMS